VQHVWTAVEAIVALVDRFGLAPLGEGSAETPPEPPGRS